ncbi:MAG: carbohydrate kinase family protein [Planctomycetota bacterium]|nr:carbohydrate kinase family protein [Planctomycetota bacterium]
MGAKIFCFGAVVADLISHEISELPGPGDSSRTASITLAVGGCAANAATGLARLGQQVSLCGAVGDDDLGTFLRRDLATEGVNLENLSTESGIPTGISFVINVEGQDRRFISATGANDEAWPERFDERQLEEAAVVSFHGFGLAKRPDVQDTESILQAARNVGATTVLDVIVIPGEDLLGDLKRLLPLVDVFLPNDDEAKRLTGSADPRQAATDLRALGAETVVVTCGDRGVVWETATDSGVFEAHPVEEVDGTGCGDAFAAGWMDACLRQGDLEEKLFTASAMGALAAGAAGAIDGLPDRSGLEQMLRTLRHSTAL